MSLARRLLEAIHPHLDGERRFYAIVGLSGALILGLLLALSPLKVLGLGMALGVTILAFWRPEAVLFFLALYVPFEPFLLKFVPDDLYVFARYFSEGLIYLIVAATAYRMVSGKAAKTQGSKEPTQLRATPIDVPFALFCVTAVASVLVNFVEPVTAVLGLRQILRFILVFFAIVYLSPSQAYAKALSAAMLAVVAFQSVLGIAQGTVGGWLEELLVPSERRFYDSLQLTTGTIQVWDPGTRVFATMGRYEQLGTFLCFFMLMIVGWLYAIKEKARRQWLWLLLGLAGTALVMTHSRAGWFGFGLGVLLIGGVIMKDWRVRVGVAASAALLAIYVLVSGIAVRYVIDLPDQTIAERILEVFSYERWSGEYYGLGRLYWIIQTPLVVVPSSPLFGVGPGMFGAGAATALGNSEVYDKLGLPFGVYGDEGFIDNNWFSLWGETGTLGFIFYIWMFFALLVMAWRIAVRAEDDFTRGLALGFCGALLAVAFQAFLGTFLEVRTLALYFWLFAGLVWVLGGKKGGAEGIA